MREAKIMSVVFATLLATACGGPDNSSTTGMMPIVERPLPAPSDAGTTSQVDAGTSSVEDAGIPTCDVPVQFQDGTVVVCEPLTRNCALRWNMETCEASCWADPSDQLPLFSETPRDSVMQACHVN